MTKSILNTLLALIVLTIITALVSNFTELKVGVTIILLVSVVKFFLVTFQFMELKKAHAFWKILILLFLMVFASIILIIK